MNYEANIQEKQRLTGKLTPLLGIDKTLKKEGYAADAKATGDALTVIRGQIAGLSGDTNTPMVTSDIPMHLSITEKGNLQITY